VCISWKLKCWILLMHGVTMKFTGLHVDTFEKITKAAYAGKPYVMYRVHFGSICT